MLFSAKITDKEGAVDGQDRYDSNYNNDYNNYNNNHHNGFYKRNHKADFVEVRAFYPRRDLP